ncbi:hypothetical protein BaRGS_00019386, partial [Batillaria attramentaria]
MNYLPAWNSALPASFIFSSFQWPEQPSFADLVWSSLLHLFRVPFCHSLKHVDCSAVPDVERICWRERHGVVYFALQRMLGTLHHGPFRLFSHVTRTPQEKPCLELAFTPPQLFESATVFSKYVECMICLSIRCVDSRAGGDMGEIEKGNEEDFQPDPSDIGPADQSCSEPATFSSSAAAKKIRMSSSSPGPRWAILPIETAVDSLITCCEVHSRRYRTSGSHEDLGPSFIIALCTGMWVYDRAQQQGNLITIANWIGLCVVLELCSNPVNCGPDKIHTRSLGINNGL